MTRNWSCYRLLGTPPPSAETLNPLLAEALPKLVGYMQTADAGSRWFFQRHDDTGSVELAFHSTAPVRRELERLLLAESDRHGWPVLPEDPASCPAACPPAPTLAEQLADARAEFVRDLRRVDHLAEPEVELAALHLNLLLDLIPVPDRRQFLFTCWEVWTRRMTPQQRISLGVRADRDATDIADTARVADTGVAHRVWYRYLTTIRAGIATRPVTDSAPLNYLLFEHAHETHRLLGIRPEAEAVAARALRTALVLRVRPTIPAQGRMRDAATLSGLSGLSGTKTA